MEFLRRTVPRHKDPQKQGQKDLDALILRVDAIKPKNQLDILESIWG
jgi:hypothetical protein